jgi:hypothetical protein
MRRYWFIRHLIRLIWWVQAPTVILVQAAPVVCLQALAAAVRPDAARLHLRHLYTDGRRYELHSIDQGFQLTTSSKVSWHYRKRTGSAAVLRGMFSPLDSDLTRIDLYTHMSLYRLLEIFMLPAAIGAIILFAPWSPVLIGVVLAALFSLSWIGHRANAALEGSEMLYFVQTAIEELQPQEIFALQAGGFETIYHGTEFHEAWERFYESQTSRDTSQ